MMSQTMMSKLRSGWYPGVLLQAMALALVLLGIVGAGWRAEKYHHPPGPFKPRLMGFGDFHNGVYFPAKAFMEGESPYGVEYAQSYPVPRPTPLFSPMVFLLHAPFALIPLAISEWLHFSLMVALAVLLAVVLIRNAGAPVRHWLLPVLAVIVISRAGSLTLVSGYFTFELILGTAVALSFARSRPWIAAVGLTLASLKPTFVIPLSLLMLAAGDWRVVWRAALMSIAGAAAAIAWLLQNASLAELLAGMRAAQETHRLDLAELPVNTWTRIDLAAVIGKWTPWSPTDPQQLVLMLCVLWVPAWLLWRARRNGQWTHGLTSPGGSLIVVAMLVSIYHQSYDALIALAPVVGMVAGTTTAWGRVSIAAKIAISLTALFPLFNITSTNFFLSRTQLHSASFQTLTSLNALALLISMIVLCHVMRSAAQEEPTAT